MKESEPNEQQVLQGTSDSLTDKPDEIVVSVKPKNRLHWWLMQKGWAKSTRTYYLYQLRYANCLRISKAILNIPEASILLESDKTQRQILQLMANHGETFIRIVAIMLTNARQEPSEELLDRIRWEFTDEEIMTICKLAVQRLHPQDFIHSIILIGGLDILKQRTPAEEVSQLTGGIIALGDSSEQQPDTLKDGHSTK